MPKKQAEFPGKKDILIIDRQPKQTVTSDSYDVIESAITQIEAELRRTTEKLSECTLTPKESGVIKLTATEDWILYLPDINDLEMGFTIEPGLPYLLFKADDNNNRITVLSYIGQTIDGKVSYTELDCKNSWVYLKSSVIGWDIVLKSKSLDMGEW